MLAHIFYSYQYLAKNIVIIVLLQNKYNLFVILLINIYLSIIIAFICVKYFIHFIDFDFHRYILNL